MVRGRGSGPSVMVSFRVKAEAAQALDEMRGKWPRSAFLRALLKAESRAHAQGQSLLRKEDWR